MNIIKRIKERIRKRNEARAGLPMPEIGIEIDGGDDGIEIPDAVLSFSSAEPEDTHKSIWHSEPVAPSTDQPLEMPSSSCDSSTSYDSSPSCDTSSSSSDCGGSCDCGSTP